MAAIAHPHPDPVPERPRPDLRLLPTPAQPARRPPPRRRSARQHAVYQRRRLVTVVALVLLAVAAWSGVASLTGPAEVSPAPAAARSVVVQPGDTYWSLAEAFGGEGDIRARVDALVAANGGAELQAGDRVEVPTSVFEG